MPSIHQISPACVQIALALRAECNGEDAVHMYTNYNTMKGERGDAGWEMRRKVSAGSELNIGS